MAIRPILEAPDPRLRVISTPVEVVDDDVRALIADMFETMYDAPGIGLAAVQIGVPKRVLVIDLQEDGEGEERRSSAARLHQSGILSEPADDVSVYNEGCLSVPDQYADVERPVAIQARWLDEKGVQHDERIEGMLATVIQHEMDHLEGILFIDHLSKLKRDMVMKKLEKARKLRKAA
jgi:peptide deformylase